MSGVIVPGYREKKDPLDTVMKGLAIARDIYGIKTAMDESDERKQRLEAEKNKSPLGQWIETKDENGSPIRKYVVDAKAGDTLPVYVKPPTEKPADTTSADRLKFDQQRFDYQKQRDSKLDAERKFAASEKAGAQALPQGQAPAIKLNAEERKRLDSASMGLAAVKEMGEALNGGSNTFSLIGDNDFTAARARFEEALGRMQSGGAIGETEAKRFAAMAPTFRDSAEMQQKKLAEIYKEMALRVKSLGADPEEILAQRASVPVPDFAPKPDGTAFASGKGGAAPGSIVRVGNQTFKVADDGDTLIPVPQPSGGR